MSTFTSKRVTSETRLARFIRSLPAINRFVVTNIKVLGIGALIVGMFVFLAPAQAKSDLRFRPITRDFSIRLPEFFAWKDAPPYKNERLAYYQGALAQRGITNREHVKILTAQLIQEAGSMNEHAIGDGGCSIGILQYNTCAHHNMMGKTYLQRYPEWNDWKYQLDYMADWVAERYETFDNNIRLIVIDHNCPACAAKGQDSKAGYYSTILGKTNLLI